MVREGFTEEERDSRMERGEEAFNMGQRLKLKVRGTGMSLAYSEALHGLKPACVG